MPSLSCHTGEFVLRNPSRFHSFLPLDSFILVRPVRIVCYTRAFKGFHFLRFFQQILILHHIVFSVQHYFTVCSQCFISTYRILTVKNSLIIEIIEEITKLLLNAKIELINLPKTRWISFYKPYSFRVFKISS